MDLFITIGPSSWSPDVLRQLFEIGVAGVRFPFAKEEPTDHVLRAQLVRELADQLGRATTLLADFPGAKPRLSNTQPFLVTRTKQYRIGLSREASENCD